MKFNAGFVLALATVHTTAASLQPSFHAVERGTHFTVMEAVSQGKTNRFTIIGNGLNWTNSLGVWVESKPMLQSFAGGIVCTGNSYQVILATNLSLNSSGAADLETSDHQRIIFQPLGIALFDPQTGTSISLAQAKDCPEKWFRRIRLFSAMLSPAAAFRRRSRTRTTSACFGRI